MKPQRGRYAPISVELGHKVEWVGWVEPFFSVRSDKMAGNSESHNGFARYYIEPRFYNQPVL